LPPKNFGGVRFNCRKRGEIQEVTFATGFAVILFLSKNAEIAVAARRAANIKPENSGTAFELMKIVWSIGDPFEWVTLPPLAPYDFEFHMMMKA